MKDVDISSLRESDITMQSHIQHSFYKKVSFLELRLNFVTFEAENILNMFLNLRGILRITR